MPQPPPPGVQPDAAREAPDADAGLVARLLHGDTGALELLYDRYSRPAYALSRRILTDDTLAEDVVQEVFLALWKDPLRYDASRGSFSGWLMAMTHHKAVDAVRREESVRRRRTRAEEAEPPNGEAAGPSVEDEVWTTLQGDDVRAALKDLPAAQREALTLAYFGGYTQREVATLTGAPLGTVKTRMLAGMRRMRDRLSGLSPTRSNDLALGEGGGS